jgi:uncharacterized protein YgbK (DUF1537 family)
MMRLRLIADDLTGALDTAARFVARTGPVAVYWAPPPADAQPRSAALDAGTREQAAAANATAGAALAAWLAPVPGTIAFWKLDSLLRGHGGAGLAACLRTLRAPRCIIAPAFPFQGRATRGGRQWAKFDGAWQPAGEALQETLRAHGIPVTLARPGDPVPPGVSLWDAETDADLRRIAAAGLAEAAPVLWSGCAGLAGALAGEEAPRGGPVAAPLVGLFGSDHPVTAAQLRAAGPHCLLLADGSAESCAALSRRVAEAGVALASFAVPAGMDRAAAAGWLERQLAGVLARIARPRTLVAAGGETLRAICTTLGATHLEVCGQLEPGAPRSTLRGGRWQDVGVISKSGAFGASDLLRRLADGIDRQRGTEA